jgi:phosphoserine phosphatase RsbU/P
VILVGTLVGVVPATVALGAGDFFGFHIGLWLGVTLTVLLWLFPLSFAYAVVKHRVLEIPVLLKRSVRYLFVQRGFTVLLTLLSIVVTLLFASSFTHYLRPLIEVAQPAGIALGSVFGTVLLWGGSQLHKRVNARIDRAFFRSAYDARLILEDLAERTRTATDREELARLLEHHLKEALQPSFLVVYLEGGDGSLTATSDSVPTELRTIPVKLPILAELARRRQPWEFPPVSEENAEKSVLALLHPECLVPVMGRGGRLVGLLVLGPRLSEGAYSGEDKRLLASVANQAGIALENIQLAEKMAERMETERRAAIEMQVAKEVQDKLLPQCAPVLRTLECAGRCIQTRSIGGDYYDFLDLGPGHVGLVLGDVSGKGISAALLMANLQASLRSRCVGSSGDIALRLSAVNEQLRKSSAEGYFATLFFADYDDVTRRLLFSNCGHNPPILLRADGAVERLTATATVLGLFEEWKCSTQETIMHQGDLLAIYSDGVTEAMNEVGEEFSEARFIASLREFRSFSPALLLTNVVRTVQEFAGGYQSDDLTLVIARAL